MLHADICTILAYYMYYNNKLRLVKLVDAYNISQECLRVGTTAILYGRYRVIYNKPSARKILQIYKNGKLYREYCRGAHPLDFYHSDNINNIIIHRNVYNIIGAHPLDFYHIDNINNIIIHRNVYNIRREYNPAILIRINNLRIIIILDNMNGRYMKVILDDMIYNRQVTCSDRLDDADMSLYNAINRFANKKLI